MKTLSINSLLKRGQPFVRVFREIILVKQIHNKWADIIFIYKNKLASVS